MTKIAFALFSLLFVAVAGAADYAVFLGPPSASVPAGVLFVDASSPGSLDALYASTGARVGSFPAVALAGGTWAPLSGRSVSEAISELREGGDSALSGGSKLNAQAFKSAKLKAYENKVILFLRSEGAIATNAVSVTQDQLNAMYDAWYGLSGNQGDAKASKYERLLRPVVRNGGTELGVRYH